MIHLGFPGCLFVLWAVAVPGIKVLVEEHRLERTAIENNGLGCKHHKQYKAVEAEAGLSDPALLYDTTLQWRILRTD